MNEIINDYHELHRKAEVGFELDETVKYVEKRLDEIKVKHTRIGKNGITATLGKGEYCILLRADMDALPIREQTDLPYACKNGNMHACGHDAHTAMLLGAAKWLKEQEKDLKCTVKLLFQPAEELLEGAKNMLDCGILESPRVDAAAMLHIVVGTELENGSAIISSAGISAPAVDYFRITLSGKGTHGSTPEKGRDPLALGCRIALAFEEIRAKELGATEKAMITVGSLHAGKAPNVIPNTAELSGSIRSYEENTRRYIKNRIEKISDGYSNAFEIEGSVDYYSGAPALVNDEKMSEYALLCAKKALGEDKAFTSAELSSKSGGGSEDFAYISEKVPSVMIALCVGKASDGYIYPLHHPKFRLDENALACGTALLCEMMMGNLEKIIAD